VFSFVRNVTRSAAFGTSLLAVALAISAGPVMVPTTFVSGTPAKAADVNANFTAVANAVNGSAQDIATLQTRVKNIPAGPQGPVGPTGATGPAGPGAMLVKDSTGKVAGSYFIAPYDPFAQPNGFTVPGSTPDEFVFIRTASQSFAVRVTAAQLGAQVDYNVSFTSTDCTGQAYLSPQAYLVGSLKVPPMLSFAAVLNTTAYIAGSMLTSGSTAAYSYLSFNDTSTVCTLYQGAGLTGQLVPVVGTFDLSTLSLVPPFSVH
jgi:hypothetical protein